MNQRTISSTVSNDRAWEFSVIGASLICAALLPIGFHSVHLGPAFLPLHIPALAAGLLLRPRSATIVGALSPWVSLALTGMPPIHVAVIMSFELAVLAMVAAFLTRGLRLNPWIAASLAVAARCAVTMSLGFALGMAMGAPRESLGWAAVAFGLPGILLQIPVAIGAAASCRRR